MTSMRPKGLLAALTLVLAIGVLPVPAASADDAGPQSAAAQSSGASPRAEEGGGQSGAPAADPAPTGGPAAAPDLTGRGAWVGEGARWWWRHSDGGYPASQWARIKGSVYSFDASGYMRTGWYREDGAWYFLTPSGAMATGWVQVAGDWYYLDPATGVMAVGDLQVGGSRYCMDPSGAMRTGWVSSGDGWRFYAPSGAMATGWVQVEGDWYYLDPATGVMRTETLVLNGRTYEFAPSGAWMGYEAPAGYLQPTDRITGLGASTNTLTWGMNGIKVMIVQRRLGIWHTMKLAIVDASFVTAVKNFQWRAGLSQTGVVDEQTWNAMGTGWPWTIDQYQAQPVPLTARRSERVEAMIGYAWNQTGTPYTWGGAGPAGLGYDCSGLVLQSLYAGGMDPQPIDVIKHGWPDYRTSQELYNYSGFQHVPLSERQRGDLVFYTSDGSVTHVAIYLGDDMVVHTDWMGRPARMQYITVGYGWDRMTWDVVRPFP